MRRSNHNHLGKNTGEADESRVEEDGESEDGFSDRKRVNLVLLARRCQ